MCKSIARRPTARRIARNEKQPAQFRFLEQPPLGTGERAFEIDRLKPVGPIFNRGAVGGVRVNLVDPSGSVIRTVQSGNDGQFAFTGLPPTVYKLTVSAPGMTTITSTQIALHAGETRIVSPVKLSVTPVTTM